MGLRPRRGPGPLALEMTRAARCPPGRRQGLDAQPRGPLSAGPSAQCAGEGKWAPGSCRCAMDVPAAGDRAVPLSAGACSPGLLGLTSLWRNSSVPPGTLPAAACHRRRGKVFIQQFPEDWGLLVSTELRTRPGGAAWRGRSRSNSGGPRWGWMWGPGGFCEVLPGSWGPAWRGQALACLLPKHWPAALMVVLGCGRPGEEASWRGWPARTQPAAQEAPGHRRLVNTACPTPPPCARARGGWTLLATCAPSLGWAQRGSPPLLGSSVSRAGSRESWRWVEVLLLPCPGALALGRGWARATVSSQQAWGPDCLAHVACPRGVELPRWWAEGRAGLGLTWPGLWAQPSLGCGVGGAPLGLGVCCDLLSGEGPGCGEQ